MRPNFSNCQIEVRRKAHIEGRQHKRLFVVLQVVHRLVQLCLDGVVEEQHLHLFD